MIPQEKARWKKQPPYAFTKLNPDHPLSIGLYDCFIFNSGARFQKNLACPGADMVYAFYSGEIASPMGVSAEGVCGIVATLGGAANYWTIPQPAASHRPGNDLVQIATGIPAPFTIRIKWRPTDYKGGGYATLVSKGSGGGRSIGIFLDGANGNISYLDVGITFSSNLPNPAAATAMSTGTLWDFVFVRELSGAISTYTNGRKIGTTNAGVTNYAYSSSDALNLNYDVHGGGTFFNAEFYIYQSWQRALSDSEILKLYEDPYCVLIPPPI